MPIHRLTRTAAGAVPGGQPAVQPAAVPGPPHLAEEIVPGAQPRAAGGGGGALLVPLSAVCYVSCISRLTPIEVCPVLPVACNVLPS